MALINNIELKYESGISVPVANAYIRIESYSGNKNTTNIYVNMYLSKEDFLNSKASLQPTQLFEFKHDVAEGACNVIKQGYEHLKTLPEFAEAVDA